MFLDRMTNVFYESGWRGDADERPMPVAAVATAITELLADMRTAGVVTSGQERLTDFGVRVVQAGIRTRAMRGGPE
jgi:hypothetical protein